MEEKFLQLALQAAATRRGFCSPNPSVGCVVTRHGKVISEGTHFAAGHPHAEVEALKSVADASGTTVYVTLEPCCFVGRTPACSAYLIEKQVDRVVFGYRDPNPKVSGKGQIALQQHGIRCDYLPQSGIDDYYESYRRWTETGLPYVSAKMALSLDGKSGSRPPAPRLKLTSENADRRTHQERKKADAILTTVATVLADDPELNIRTESPSIPKPVYVLDRQLRFSLTAKLKSTSSSLTLFHEAGAPADHRMRLEEAGIRCLTLPKDNTGLLLEKALEQIGKDGVHELWVEAGPQLFSSLHQKQLLQRTLIYVAPTWIGRAGETLRESPKFEKAKRVQWTELGVDALCEVIW